MYTRAHAHVHATMWNQSHMHRGGICTLRVHVGGDVSSVYERMHPGFRSLVALTVHIQLTIPVDVYLRERSLEDALLPEVRIRPSKYRITQPA